MSYRSRLKAFVIVLALILVNSAQAGLWDNIIGLFIHRSNTVIINIDSATNHNSITGSSTIITKTTPLQKPVTKLVLTGVGNTKLLSTKPGEEPSLTVICNDNIYDHTKRQHLGKVLTLGLTAWEL